MSASVAASPSSFLPIPPARDIPLTFTASLKSWWHAGEKQGACCRGARLPFFVPEKMPTSSAGDSPVIARTERMDLATPKHYLNTLSIRSTNTVPNAPPPAVVLHGYGAGLGFFFRNYPALATWAGHRGTDVYALDWLGMGRSARVPFHVKAKRDDVAGRVREAEAFFVDSLEEWRDKMGLDKMTLIGHSLGAYFSVAYALRYPTRVNKLIYSLPLVIQASAANARPATSASTSAVSHIRNEQRAARNQESRTMKLVTYLWEEGWSPFQLVRSTLFWGPMLVGKYSSRRFSSLTEDETRDMHEYILNITLSKGSGEYCISHILAPFAHARMPLVDRISALKMPITFVYGEHDWMDPVGGLQSLQQLREAGNHFGRMFVIPSAGHHLYLENPRAVDDLLIQELDLTDKQH
ncbi:Alpha/Beta hydrolase protein [Pisolithus thermaeus]|nr:Alpha/Beta hydrolase protein [Pisolithus thermaeus]